MSPEQANGVSEADVRSDIYSLGAMAYYLLPGQPPFTGGNVAQVLRAHAEESVPPLSELRPGVPADMEAVVLRCLEKEPMNRFGDVRQLEEAWTACACSGQWTDKLATEWWNRFESGEAQVGQ
jgi:serine/threonine-protein kinase